MRPHRWLLATGNAGKLREMRRLTEGMPVEWLGLADFPGVVEPVETGRTFAENARLKALYYAAATGLNALADDSGLEVDALDGAPGVDSAYFAGHPCNDSANNQKLVELLRALPDERRTARYRCAMAFVVGGRVLFESDGAVEGRIVLSPRGSNGFGYDPHFLVPDRSQTMAELAPADKDAISHRGAAMRAMLARLSEYLARA